MDRVVGELQRRAMELRTTPLQRIVEPLQRTAREIARRLGKRVEVIVLHADVELDRSILDRLSDPLVHLIRNAVDHGIEMPDVRVASGKEETGRIEIEAFREKDSIRIEVRDDGAGIDLDSVREHAVEAGLLIADLAEDLPPDEIAAFVFHPGLSTAKEVSDLSGRGVGMDAVRATIESLGGSVDLTTRPACGTNTMLRVPVTAAMQRVLLVGVAKETLAIPVFRVERVIEVDRRDIEKSGDEAFVLVDDDPIPVLRLADQMTLESERRTDEAGDAVEIGRRHGAEPSRATLVLVDVREERMAIQVDRVAGQAQIYVKPVPELLVHVKALAGLTILGDGRPVFVLDLNQLA
ncbi:MAG: chemotaxis protein CheW [Myxococcales bacterium]|nr:chemotaxis protein CheW [Myxococcales bacterium]